MSLFLILCFLEIPDIIFRSQLISAVWILFLPCFDVVMQSGLCIGKSVVALSDTYMYFCLGVLCLYSVSHSPVCFSKWRAHISPSVRCMSISDPYWWKHHFLNYDVPLSNAVNGSLDDASYEQSRDAEDAEINDENGYDIL